MIESVITTLAACGPVIQSDVERACRAQGIRLFADGEIGETLRQMQDAGEIEPSGRWLDPRTRLPLFRTAAPARPKVSPEDAQYRAFASMMGLDVESVRVVEATDDAAPVERRPTGVSEQEEAEYASWAAMFEEGI